MIRTPIQRLSTENELSISIQALNAESGPLPITPIESSVIFTVPQQSAVNVQNQTIFDSLTVQALISQQSATNSTLADAEKREKGILPGVAGLTVQQASRPGMQLKPGAAEFINSKLRMGLPYNSAIRSNLLTGNLGVTNVQSLLKNSAAQSVAVRTSIQQSTSNLISSGVISGKEASTQIGGLVLAVSVFGKNNVFNTIGKQVSAATSNIKQSTETLFTSIKSIPDAFSAKVTDIKNMFSSGNFAASVSDSITGGLNNIIGSSLGKLLGKSTSISVQQLAAQFSSSAKSAFIAAKQSIGKLIPNKPNYSSNQATLDFTSSETELALRRLSSVDTDIKFSVENYELAKIEYNKNPSMENYASMINAKVSVNNAEQALSKIKKDITSTITTSNPLLATIAKVRSGVSDAQAILKNKLLSFTSAGKDAQTLVGSIFKGAAGSFASLIKMPTFAKNTFNVSNSQSATVTTLIADSRVPPSPTQVDYTETSNISAETALVTQNKLIKTINDLIAEKRLLQIKMTKIYSDSDFPSLYNNAAKLNELQTITDKLNQINQQIIEAENALVIAQQAA